MKDFVRHAKSDSKKKVVIDKIDKELLTVPGFERILQNIGYKGYKGVSDQEALQILIT